MLIEQKAGRTVNFLAVVGGPMPLVSAAREQIESVGFRVAHQSTALTFLVHPECPGVLVRIGTVFVVVERDQREVARFRLDTFRVQDLFALLPEIGRKGERERSAK